MNRTVHLVDVPIGGKGGFVWNRLHGEREEICEVLLENSGRALPLADPGRARLQGRLRKIDDALDRLMSGSYGICSKCGRSIEESTLEVDPAMGVCVECWSDEPHSVPPEVENELTGSDLPSELMFESLKPFDTILLQTQHSEYRILLLDPRTGKALVEGGRYLVEPGEAMLVGSATPEYEFHGGAICLGCRLEMWTPERAILTSPIKSVEVKRSAPAESTESIAAALH